MAVAPSLSAKGEISTTEYAEVKKAPRNAGRLRLLIKVKSSGNFPELFVLYQDAERTFKYTVGA